VVKDDVPIPCDGILGSEFLRDNNAILDYNKRNLIMGNDYSILQQKKIRVPARTVPVSFNITNPEKTEGYVPRCEPVKGPW